MSKRPTGLNNKRIRDTPESVSENGTSPKAAADESQTSDSAQSTPSLDIHSSKMPTLDFSPPETEKEFQRTGARSSKGSLSSSEKRRRLISRVTLALLAVGFGAHTVYMGREWGDDELQAMKMASPNICAQTCPSMFNVGL
jgi:import inner membrane translocase subunit TIM50